MFKRCRLKLFALSGKNINSFLYGEMSVEGGKDNSEEVIAKRYKISRDYILDQLTIINPSGNRRVLKRYLLTDFNKKRKSRK